MEEVALGKEQKEVEEVALRKEQKVVQVAALGKEDKKEKAEAGPEALEALEWNRPCWPTPAKSWRS